MCGLILRPLSSYYSASFQHPTIFASSFYHFLKHDGMRIMAAKPHFRGHLPMDIKREAYVLGGRLRASKFLETKTAERLEGIRCFPPFSNHVRDMTCCPY